MYSPLIPGTYKLTDSKNFENFLKKLGIGLVKRKAASAATTTLVITVQDDIWNVKTLSTFKCSECKFKLNEEFTEERLDGVKVQSLVTVDEKNNNVVKQIQKGGTVDVVIVRTFSEKGIETVCEADGVVSNRYYTRKV